MICHSPPPRRGPCSVSKLKARPFHTLATIIPRMSRPSIQTARVVAFLYLADHVAAVADALAQCLLASSLGQPEPLQLCGEEQVQRI
jgi:hypothetical protein